jgi:aerobic carbon-monoxide dehydrogenase medium subunit
MTTIDAIGSSEVIRAEFPALAEAAQLVGDAQVRNRATIGGNLAASDPEADLPALMLALDAGIHLTGTQGWRKVSASDFFDAPAHIAAARDELIAAVVIPVLPEHSGTAYLKLKHPARLYAVCGVAAVLTLANGRIAASRVALTGAADHPSRLHRVEQSLLNGPGTEEAVAAAASVSDQGINFRGDFFASAEYRRHLTRVLSGRALKQALARAAA